MFVEYTYYTDSFAGSLIPAEEFSPLEREAERLLGYITQKKYLTESRSETIITVKNALCSAVEEAYELNLQYANIPLGIKSESTDGHSVTFDRPDPSNLTKQRRKLMYDIFAQELFYTGLLYQGVSGYDDES